MRVFVGVSYDRDNETAICGASDCRETARRLVEQARNEILHWAREATDGPDGGARLDDHNGDCVGHVLAFDVAGSAKLKWVIDSVMGHLTAHSILHDCGSPLWYTVSGDGDNWKADFDGRDFASGSLEHCMAACRKSEDDAILQSMKHPDDNIRQLVRAAVRAYQELNTIRARDGVPYKRDGYKSDVCPEYFSAVVDQLNDAVIRATGHSAHCHPELSMQENEQ